jgi:L-lactate dehydrogenase complex protein LldE
MSEVRLFSTCLAEEFFPSAAESAVLVLERLKLKVRPLKAAFCCGQAPFNEGLRDSALELARIFLKACEPGVPIVIPSGSCASMTKIFYSDLLSDQPALAEKAAAIRPWLFEFSQFLVNVVKIKYVGARYDRVVAYHPSCHLARELRVTDEPRLLLGAVDGL